LNRVSVTSSRASYSDAPRAADGSYTYGKPNDEYFAGSTISLSMENGNQHSHRAAEERSSLVLPVLRWATPADFSNGGEVNITVTPNGHDTWKIQSLPSISVCK